MNRFFGWASGSSADKAGDVDAKDDGDGESDKYIDDYDGEADDIYDSDGESVGEDDDMAEEETLDDGWADEDPEVEGQHRHENDVLPEPEAEDGDADVEEISDHDNGEETETDDPQQNEVKSPPEEKSVVNDAVNGMEREEMNPPNHEILSTIEGDKEEHDYNAALLDDSKDDFLAEAKPSTSPTCSADEGVKLDDADDICVEENKRPTSPSVTIVEEAKPDSTADDIHDSFPRAQDFLADMEDDGITLVNQAASILEGFNEGDDQDDAKTIATHRTNATRVQPVSAAFRSAMAQKDEAEQKMRNPHQSIFDILDRNFEELGDGSSRGGGRQVGYKDVKLCFVAFVAVFSLPTEPVFANAALDDEGLEKKSSFDSETSDQMNSDNDNQQTADAKHDSSQDKPKESLLQRVPLSVAFALWSNVLQQSHGPNADESANNERLSYIRSTLVLLGLLDLAAIDKDRDNVVSSSNGNSFGYSNKSIECLVVHDSIHQHYGEYLAYGGHKGAYRSLIEEAGQQWNEAAMKESKQIGSNQYTVRMLPLNTMRAHHMQDAFDLLNDKTFVRRRIRLLGASGAAKAHVGDVDELLSLIEKQVISADSSVEEIDEQDRLMGAYQQVLKHCLHDTEELTKHHKDDEGIVRLGKTDKYRTADVGNALHLLGASLGGYGFFEEEMEYYEEALRLKKLSVNGHIEKSVSASDTLHSMGFSLDNAGRSDEALECYDQALRIRFACLGDDDLRIAETQHNKGALLCEEDRAEEAMQCLEEALHIRELYYGEEHESCADTMQWMGNLLRKHGDQSEALDYFKFALSIKQKRLGSDDIDVANTLFNTAVLLDDIEKFELSLVAYKEALRIRKLVLGEHNHEVADTLFCIGNVATVLENHEEALGFYKESIEIREALIQDDDPFSNKQVDTLLFIMNPTPLRSDLLSMYEKLNQCCEEALPLTKLIMGTNHPDVGNLLNRMGEVYKKLHDWDNTIGSFQGALRAKRAAAPEGQDNLDVAELLQKKGEAHLYKNEFHRAKATFDSAMQVMKRILGADAMAVASSTYCLGIAYHYLNDFSHAKLLFQECMRIQIKLAGENDACIVRPLCWIGRQHEKLKEPGKALERYLSALQIYKKEKTHIDYRIVAMLLHAIGGLYEDDKVSLEEMALKCYNEEISLLHSKLNCEEMQTISMLADAHFKPGMLCKRRGDADKSIDHLEKALELTKQCDGEKDIKVATISDNLGMLYASKKEFAEAKKYYSSAYSVYEKSVGRDDLSTSDCAFRLGEVLEALKSNLALDFYKESLRVHRMNMSEDDERVAEILFCSGRILLKTEDHQNAVKYFEEALEIRKRLLGDCSDLADTYHNLGKAYSGISQSEKALIFYRESVRINKKISQNDALYKVSLDMAQCSSYCSHYQLAIDCYNNCLQVAESLENKGKETALVLQWMGEIQMNKLEHYSDATKLLLDALEILRGISAGDNGEDQNIMSLILLIAQAYESAKDYKNSLNYYEEHIKMLESRTSEDIESRALDDEDILLADSLYAMGNIHASMEKNPDFELAIEKLLDCLDIKKDVFGADEEQVANVVYKLGIVYEQAGYHDKAIEFLAEALRSFKMKQNKAGSVKVFHALARLKASKAAELDSLSDRSAAIECYKEALKIRRQIMSLDDIELATMLHEYANLLCSNHEHEAAQPLLEEALRIQKSKKGLKNECIANILLRMAEVHVHQENFDASLVCLEQVLFIQSSLGDNNADIDLGSCHYLFGTTHLARGDFQKAIASYLKCMEIKKLKFGSNSLECAAVHNDLGKVYGKVNDFNKAMESLVQALKVRKLELGNDSLDYGHSVFNLAEIHIAKSKYDQALNCLSEAVRVYELFADNMGKEIEEALVLKGDALYELKDYDAASSVFQECVDRFHSNEDGDSHSHGSSIACDARSARLNYKMGDAFAKLEEYDEALDSYREAISIFSNVFGKDDLRVGEVMYDVGHLIISQGGIDMTEKSLECFSEVIRIYALQGKEKDKKVADSLFQKSTLLADCSKYDEATSKLEDAIDIYKASLGADAVEIGKAMLLYGRIHDAQGKNNESMSSFDEALRIFQKSLGEDDINVSLALQNIGIIHARKEEYTEAVEKCKKALKIRVLHGEQDHDVADSVFNLANILNDCEEVDDAYQYFQQALKLYVHLVGEDDVSVANCQQKLGVIYWERRDIDRSLSSFLDALRICEQEDEVDVAHMLGFIYRGIGDCYYNKGEYNKALENFAKCLRIHKMELGDNCIEMAAPCDFIGLIYQEKEKYAEAMNFHSKAFLINEKHHGKGSKECSSPDFQVAKTLLASHQYEECIARLREHLQTFCDGTEDDEEVAEVYHPLGLAQSKLGRYEESVTSLHKTLDIRTKLFGKTDIKVAETMLDLGKVFEECGESEEAIAVYDQAITIFHEIPDSDFRAVASAYSRLGSLFEEKGNCEASLHSWKKALQIFSTNSGSDTMVVGEILFHIGKLYDQLDKYDKSASCFSEAVKILRSQGEESIMIGQALGYIGKNYARKKQYETAVELSTESLRLQKKFAEAGDIAESLEELGKILKAWGKPDQAMQFFEEALRTFEEAIGCDSLEVANCGHNIGILKKKLGENEIALKYFGEALRVHRMKEGDTSLNVANNLFQIGQIFDSYGKKEKSMKCFEECLKIRLEMLGDDHIDVLAAQRYIRARR